MTPYWVETLCKLHNLIQFAAIIASIFVVITLGMMPVMFTDMELNKDFKKFLRFFIVIISICGATWLAYLFMPSCELLRGMLP